MDNIQVSFSFFLSFFHYFWFLCYVIYFVIINVYKNILILLLFYLFQLFFHKNYLNFFMVRDVPGWSGMFRDGSECSVIFRVPRFIDGRISFRLADRG